MLRDGGKMLTFSLKLSPGCVASVGSWETLVVSEGNSDAFDGEKSLTPSLLVNREEAEEGLGLRDC